jgi:hypothetical protein
MLSLVVVPVIGARPPKSEKEPIMSSSTILVPGAAARRCLFALATIALLAGRLDAATQETLVVSSSTSSRSASADYVCTGTSDQTTINTAISALPTSGGTVFLTDGTFNLSNYIDLGTRTGVRIVGSGPGTILRMSNGANTSAIRGTSVIDITLADFAIDGNAANNTGGKGLQFLTNTADTIKVDRLYIYNTSDAAIGITCLKVTIQNCEIYNCAKGVQFNNGADNCYVTACRIHDIGMGVGQLADAISCQGSRCRFEANVIWNASDTGINIASQSGVGHNAAIDNEVYLCGNSGINTGGAHHDVIIGNMCYANGRKTATPRSNAGIYVRDRTDGTDSSSDVIVLGNRCWDDTTTYPLPAGAVGQLYGLALHKNTGAAPSNVIATGNDFTGNLSVGIFRENVGSGVVLQANLGDTTFNNGTSTIASGSSSIVVNHGLSATPTAASISVTPNSSLANATTFWVSNVTATQFTINVNTTLTASATFGWQAHVYNEPLK